MQVQGQSDGGGRRIYFCNRPYNCYCLSFQHNMLSNRFKSDGKEEKRSHILCNNFVVFIIQNGKHYSFNFSF